MFWKRNFLFVTGSYFWGYKYDLIAARTAEAAIKKYEKRHKDDKIKQPYEIVDLKVVNK